jgi:hypothetical protein
MSRDDFFDNLFNETTPAAEDIKALRQLAYEERVIKRVFTECGIKPQSWGRMANDCRHKTDEPKLNFSWFNSTYTEFPGKLLGKRIPFIHSIKLPELFKPAPKNKLIKAILKAIASFEVDPAAEPCTLVFPLIKTPFCAHNIEGVGFAHPAADDTRWQFVYRSGNVKRPMFIEPLSTFGAAIGGEWYSA